MKKVSKIQKPLILLLFMQAMIVSISNCQTPSKRFVKDSTQLGILQNLQNPAVKKTLVRVLSLYPIVLGQRDSLETIVSDYKMETSILKAEKQDCQIQQEKSAESIQKLESHNAKIKKKLNHWRIFGLGLGVGIAIKRIINTQTPL